MSSFTDDQVKQLVDDLRQEILDTVLKAFKAQEKLIDERFNRLELRVDQQEQLQAMLSSGYAELAAMMEAILSVVINKDEEQRKEFFTALGDSRKTMLETLGHATQYAESTADRFVAYSPEPHEGSGSNTDSND